MNDIYTNVGNDWNGIPTVAIHSLKEGYLGSIVDPDLKWRQMFAVSMVDHLTEPRSVEQYVIKESPKLAPRWEFLIVRDGSASILGVITGQGGAERLLRYLKSRAE